MLTASTRLGPYEIVGLLGAGGMGEVYRARDARLGREVAVKILPERFAQDPERRARFEREARAVAALSHPNILAIHDYGRHESVTYAVMELLEGETLRSRLANGPLPWREAVEVGMAVADGLAAAHAKGIIHRDLKPENLFLTSGGRVKILDFGLARFDTRPSDAPDTKSFLPAETALGIVMGTLGYMSPEQVRGLMVDARSDLFSLGSVLYEMVAGQRAFQRKTAADTTAAILHDEPRELAALGITAPSEVEHVIRRCLGKDPASRFPSADDLAASLRALLVGAASPPQLPTTAPLRPRGRRRPGKAIDSLAILPLLNASDDPDMEYLSDGITDSTIRTLSQLPKLRVMARSTVFRFKGREVDASAVGRELNVRAVLTGRVLRRADRLILRAELVDTADGAQLWGEEYNRPVADLLAVEEEIAREIAGRLRLRLTATQRRRLDRRPTGNAEAYQFYIRGRFYWNQFTEDSTRKAIECFRQALAKDPEYALAYAGLADCYSVLGVHFWRPSEAFPEAKKALKRALELDDTLADVHVSLGFVLVCYDWQWPAAEREFQEALRLNPNLALAHSGYGFFLCTVGRVPESIAAYERAQKLDPLFPSAAADIAWCHFLVGRLDRALAACQHALEVDPNYRWAVLNLALFHVLSGSCEKAVAFAEKARGAGPEDPNALAVLGYVYARGGRTDVARATLAALEALAQRGYVAPFVRALVHAGLGEADEAFHWLRRAYEDRNHQLIGLARDPMLASLRTDPRFAALVRDVGSPCGAEAAEHQP